MEFQLTAKESEIIIEKLKSNLTAIPDFPQPGILFQDIFPLFKSPELTGDLHIDAIVGLDSRGFLLGPWIASILKCAFVPCRKAGKLPGKCVKIGYEKEYGMDYFEMQADAINPGDNVIVLDDLIATGGSAHAAQELVKLLKGTVLENVFFIELMDLKGSEKLSAETWSIMKF